MPRTRMQILEARLAEKRRAVDELERQIQWMHRDKAMASSCGYCGKAFTTDASYWSHFIITDERCLNLGDCPVKLGLPVPD